MAFIEPLDLETIFINYLAGSLELYFALALLVIAILGGMFRMPLPVFIIMVAMFFYIQFLVIGSTTALALAVLIIVIMAFLASSSIAKMFRR